MKSYRGVVDAELDRMLPAASSPPVRLHEAMRYSIFSGGKRLRPMLVLMACETCGGNISDALRPACVFEMIHTYSLIHDDLPAMDNDDFRRGNPTCHKKYDEATAILAGDALLTHAFEHLAVSLRPEHILLIAEIARAAGTPGMIGGQAADVEGEKLAPSAGMVEFIHLRKTAALIRQAVRTGATIAGADGATIERCTRYGEEIGVAFQIADDILDIEGTTEQLGKTAGKDTEAGKQTYPAVFGLAESKKMAAARIEQAVEALEPFGDKADLLRMLAKYIIDRKT